MKLCGVYFSATFSRTSPLSDRKVPLKQQRRRRLRKRHLKSEFALLQTLSRLFQVVKCGQIFLKLNSTTICVCVLKESKFRKRKKKLSCVHVLDGTSLRSKRFRLLSETEEGTGFSVFAAREMKQEPKPHAIFCAVFDSRSLFFAPKPHGNACYAGYDGK